MKKLWQKIKMLFNTIVTWFGDVIAKHDELVNKIAPFAVNICNFIKEYNDSAIIEALKTWASSTSVAVASAVTLLDKWLTDENMDKLIVALNIADAAADTQNVGEKLTLILNYVKTLETSQKAIAWTTISALIAEALSDGELSWQELYTIVKAIYDTNSNE